MVELRDQEAMRLAIEQLLRMEPEWSDQVAAMLRSQPWEQVGAFAAAVCQTRALGLKPWECPPCDTANVKEPADVYGSRVAEVALLRRMLAAGVSRFDPNPLQALAAIERAA
jgi:hypothetical protein